MPRPPKEVTRLRNELEQAQKIIIGLRADIVGATNSLNDQRKLTDEVRKSRDTASRLLHEERGRNVALSDKLRAAEMKLNGYARIFADLAVAYDDDKRREEDVEDDENVEYVPGPKLMNLMKDVGMNGLLAQLFGKPERTS